jgi:hypothetical protein
METPPTENHHGRGKRTHEDSHQAQPWSYLKMKNSMAMREAWQHPTH